MREVLWPPPMAAPSEREGKMQRNGKGFMLARAIGLAIAVVALGSTGRVDKQRSTSSSRWAVTA
jgi:hypothetical protein